jgi:hypothetical protein
LFHFILLFGLFFFFFLPLWIWNFYLAQWWSRQHF